MHNAQSKIILQFTLISFTKTALISNFEKNPLEMNQYHFVYINWVHFIYIVILYF